MYQGKLVEEADVKTLFSAPRERAAGTCAGCSAHRRGTSEGSPGAPPAGQRAGPMPLLWSRRRACASSTPGACVRRTSWPSTVSTWRFALARCWGSWVSQAPEDLIGRAIAGLTRVSGGSLSVLGVEMNGVRERTFKPVRKRIGFVFQDPATGFQPLAHDRPVRGGAARGAWPLWRCRRGAARVNEAPGRRAVAHALWRPLPA